MTVEINQESSFSNDATKKILGFEYQKLIALECCLNSKPEDIIYIECYGDIATADEIIETKHHSMRYTMTDQSSDFWKTIMNFVKEKEITSQYSKLILHTTGILKDNSIFSNWNEKKGHEKFKLISEIRRNPNDGIKEYTRLIFNFNKVYKKEDLIKILTKLEIRVSQPDIIDKYNELKNHSTFIAIEEKYRDDVLKYLIGHITKRAIDDRNQWRIICCDFFEDFRSYVRKFTTEYIPFPEVSNNIVLTGDENFAFIRELKDIEIEIEEIEEAIIDYFKTEESSIKLIKWGGPSVTGEINIFENDLYRKMKDTKKLHVLDFPFFNASKLEEITHSKKLYFKCKSFEKLRIRGVQDIDLYFQLGKMHKIVNEGNFNWNCKGGF